MQPELLAPEIPVALYRPSYRSFVFSCNTQPQTLRFHFNDGSALQEGDPLKSDDYFVRWVIDSFQHFARQLDSPWMIVHGDYFLHHKMELPEESLEIVRAKGLNIFMYERLFVEDHLHNELWNLGHPTRFIELEQIAAFVRAHNITAPVTVMLCERGLDKILQSRADLSPLRFKSYSAYFQLTVEDHLTHKPQLDIPISKKFISLNFRYEGLREMLVGHLAARGFLEDSLVTFFHTHNEAELRHLLPFAPEEIEHFAEIHSALKKLQTRLPLSLETKQTKALDPMIAAIPDYDGWNLRDQEILDRDFIPHGFVFVYGESRPFSPRSEVSEKTIHPIFARKPFLPFAAPYFLANLRDMGFKTFSDYWDESFDTIECPARRFQHYLKVVDDIGARSMEELQEILIQMQPILSYNLLWIRNSVLAREMANIYAPEKFATRKP